MLNKLLEGDFSNLNELNDSFAALLLYERHLKQLRSTRYVTPREHRSYSVWVYELDLRKFNCVDFGGKSDMVDFLGIKMKIHLDSDS